MGLDLPKAASFWNPEPRSPLIALRWPRPDILLAFAEAAVELRASSLEEPAVFPGSLEHDWL